MNHIAVLQARSSSTRLPGKVMLPVAGMPVAVLAAERAGNTGIPVVVATSVDASDDAFSSMLESYGLTVFRGSLNNTLARFVGALASMDDDGIVFRLTADNVLPDGSLLEELEAYFIERGLSYLACGGVESGLPYGLSVEVTRVKYLRDAALNASSVSDLEHVTPLIRKMHGTTFYSKHKALDLSRLRCTIDNFDDYLHILRLFDGALRATSTPWLELVHKLGALDPIAAQGNLHNKLVLGSAQFGLNYGIANRDGKPSVDVAHSLIKRAVDCGVSYIDTARAYGESERVIGALSQRGWQGRFKVITKLSPLSDLDDSADRKAVLGHVEASVFKSCAALGMQRLDVLMLHRASHLWSHGGAVWDSVVKLHRDDVIGCLGVSVQNVDEALVALDEPKIAFLQMPYNVLDSRWDCVISKIRTTRQQRSLIVHVRSSLLQGLLASEDRHLWARAHVSPAGVDQILNWLQAAVITEERESVIDLCLSYVASQDWVDGVVIGMETTEQLLANLRLLSLPMMKRESLERIVLGRPCLAEKSLDPANWLKI